MNTIKISTKYSKSFKIKSKTFIVFLRNPSIIEIYGNCTMFQIKIENSGEEFLFEYEDEHIWELSKQAKKEDRKKKKQELKNKIK